MKRTAAISVLALVPFGGTLWVSEALSRGANSSGPDRARNRDLRNAGSRRPGVEQTHTGNRVGQPHLHDSGGIRSLASITRHVLPRLGPPPPVAHGRRTKSHGTAEGEGRGDAPETFHLEPRTIGRRRGDSRSAWAWHRVRSPGSSPRQEPAANPRSRFGGSASCCSDRTGRSTYDALGWRNGPAIWWAGRICHRHPSAQSQRAAQSRRARVVSGDRCARGRCRRRRDGVAQPSLIRTFRAARSANRTRRQRLRWCTWESRGWNA